MSRQAGRHVRGLITAAADLFVRHLPDVQPVVFDAERNAAWAQMVEDAQYIDDPIPYTLTDKAA